MIHRLCWGALALAMTRSPGVAQAQQVTPAPTGAIVGRLVDHDSRAPVKSARVAILGADHGFASDSDGRFRDDDLPSGTYVLQARAIGYATTSWLVRLRDGEVLTQVFELPLLRYTLDPVVVRRRPGSNDAWSREFERRRVSGRGYFITEAQIEATHPHALVDVLRNVPGIQMVCAGASHCSVRMARAPRNCKVAYVVDGFPATNSTSPDMATAGIAAIEVYRTASETPLEFLKTDNACGTIVLWTRSGPPRTSAR